MKTSCLKFITVLTLNLLISVPVYAKLVEQKELNFPVRTEELLNGDIHYFFKIITPRKLAVQYPELFELDSLSLNQESDVLMMVTKSVSVVSKAAGFFEEKQLTDEKFISHLLEGQKVHKEDDHLFQISGPQNFSYRMQVFFDADDVSNSPNSKVLRAVNSAKKLDVISQSASNIMFIEKTKFTKLTKGGVAVSSYLPVKENKTLIVSYQLWAIPKNLKRTVLKQSFVSETESMKKLIDSY